MTEIERLTAETREIQKRVSEILDRIEARQNGRDP